MQAENCNEELIEKQTENLSLEALIDYFRIFRTLIISFLLIFYELCSKSKWESSRWNAASSNRGCENNIERSSLLQNDLLSFENSSKICSSFFLPYALESITIGALGYALNSWGRGMKRAIWPSLPVVFPKLHLNERGWCPVFLTFLIL